jgi:hypothetical protein
VEITINSPKYGKCKVLVDECFREILKNRTLYIWGTPRHRTLYVRVQLPKGLSQCLHLFLFKQEAGTRLIDHINGNGLDNRRENLRFTDSVGNNCNARKRKNARTSKYKGVHYCTSTGKYKAQIQYLKKKYSGGTFSTEREAALAYNELALKYHKDCAVLNEVK